MSLIEYEKNIGGYFKSECFQVVFIQFIRFDSHVRFSGVTKTFKTEGFPLKHS